MVTSTYCCMLSLLGRPQAHVYRRQHVQFIQLTSCTISKSAATASSVAAARQSSLAVKEACQRWDNKLSMGSSSMDTRMQDHGLRLYCHESRRWQCKRVRLYLYRVHSHCQETAKAWACHPSQRCRIISPFMIVKLFICSLRVYLRPPQ